MHTLTNNKYKESSVCSVTVYHGFKFNTSAYINAKHCPRDNTRACTFHRPDRLLVGADGALRASPRRSHRAREAGITQTSLNLRAAQS